MGLAPYIGGGEDLRILDRKLVCLLDGAANGVDLVGLGGLIGQVAAARQAAQEQSQRQYQGKRVEQGFGHAEQG